MLVRPGFELATSRSAARHSPDFANQTAELKKNLEHCYLIMEILTNLVTDLDKHFGQKSTANFTIRHYSYQFEFPLFRKGK